MNRSERLMLVILRTLGIGGLLALPTLLLPFGWMDAIHRFAGLGELPDAPITRYLARSVSSFYAVVGSLALCLSFDVRRYRPVIRLWSWVLLAFGITILVIDLTAPMPWLWILLEGPPSILVGLLAVVGQKGIREPASS